MYMYSGTHCTWAMVKDVGEADGVCGLGQGKGRLTGETLLSLSSGSCVCVVVCVVCVVVCVCVCVWWCVCVCVWCVCVCKVCVCLCKLCVTNTAKWCNNEGLVIHERLIV